MTFGLASETNWHPPASDARLDEHELLDATQLVTSSISNDSQGSRVTSSTLVLALGNNLYAINYCQKACLPDSCARCDSKLFGIGLTMHPKRISR